MAVNLHGLGRTTQSLDLFLSPDPENIEKLKRALTQVFADPCIAEISAELWGEAGDPAYLRHIAWLWAFADRLYPRRFPPGVYRLRSIDEASRQRQDWDATGAQRASKHR